MPTVFSSVTRSLSRGRGGQGMSGVSAILLAAGESRRMGPRNKMTLPVAGVPLLRRIASTLANSQVGEIVAVLGHEEQTARALLAELPLRLVTNERYREGQMTSVYRGLEALSEPCKGIMVCLSDQPLLRVEDIDCLVHAFEQQCPGSVLIPAWQGRRGNPVILAHEHRDAILAGGGISTLTRSSSCGRRWTTITWCSISIHRRTTSACCSGWGPQRLTAQTAQQRVAESEWSQA
jgi:molybdenum cofactor cytidylyltransferase